MGVTAVKNLIKCIIELHKLAMPDGDPDILGVDVEYCSKEVIIKVRTK